MQPGAIEVWTLTPGGQTPVEVAGRVVEFVGRADRTLELALYDVRLPDPTGSLVADALNAAAQRGVSVRLIYNLDHDRPIAVPPPPRTEPDLIESLPLPTRSISGVPDLMHHKYAVRDGEAVWTGSANWTEDSWSLQENVTVIVESPAIAAAYRRNFDELWTSREVERSGFVEPRPAEVGGMEVRAWFTPGRGSQLSHRIAKGIGRARRRVRIASPVITAGPILGTLAEVASEGKLDLAGVVDAPQMSQVVRQWRANERSAWKVPILAAVVGRAPFAGKPSTPYQPGSVHDFMHAKVTVADDTVFTGSFNLSHSGEMNAENVLEIHDARLADRLADFIDQVRARYPAVPVPDIAGGGRLAIGSR